MNSVRSAMDEGKPGGVMGSVLDSLAARAKFSFRRKARVSSFSFRP